MWRQCRAWSALGALVWGGLGCQVLGGIDELSVVGAGGADGSGGAASSSVGSGASSSSSSASGSGGGGPNTLSALWSVRFGDATTQKVSDVAVNIDGTIFVVGSFLGVLDFGPAGIITSANDYDIFVVALDPVGKPLWARAFGGTGPDRANCVFVGGSGGVFVGGEHTGTLALDSSTLTSAGGLNAFVIKLLPDTGATLWGTTLGDAKDQRINAIARNPTTTNLYAVGDFEGTLKLGATTFSNLGSADVFVEEFTPQGIHVSALRGGDAAIQSATAAAIGSQDEIFVAGVFDGTIDLGSGSQPSAGGLDGFVTRIAPAPMVPWLERFGDASMQRSNALSANPKGGVIVAGTFEGTFDMFGKAILSQGGRDVFVASVQNDGKSAWISTFGDADPAASVDDQEGYDVIINNAGNVFVTGYVAGSANFGSNTTTTSGDVDVFLAALDATGKTLWSTRHGGPDSQFGRALAFASNGDIIVAGDFSGDLDFGNGTLTSAGSNDLFVAQFPQTP